MTGSRGHRSPSMVPKHKEESGWKQTWGDFRGRPKSSAGKQESGQRRPCLRMAEANPQCGTDLGYSLFQRQGRSLGDITAKALSERGKQNISKRESNTKINKKQNERCKDSRHLAVVSILGHMWVSLAACMTHSRDWESAYTRTCTDMHTLPCAHAHAHMLTHMLTCTHAHMHPHSHAYTHAHMHTHIHAHMHMHTCSHTCSHAHTLTCTHTHVHTHMLTCTHTRSHAHTLSYAYTHTCSYAHTRTCSHAHTHTGSNTS